MKIQIELTEESRDLLLRHFKEATKLHQVLERATRKDVAGIAVYATCSRQRRCWKWREIIARRR